MHRPSRLWVRVSGTAAEPQVAVGGHVVPVGKGAYTLA